MRTAKIKFLNENAKLFKSNATDACWDAVAVSKKVYPDGRIEYGLGFSMELPEGTQLDLRARSSIHQTGLVLSNGIGTGDEEYRGEYKVVFYHVVPSLPPYEVGDRCIQIQVVDKLDVDFVKVDFLNETNRGDGGFGSTGK